MRYDISGSVMQTVSIDLQRGEKLYSQTAIKIMKRPTPAGPGIATGPDL